MQLRTNRPTGEKLLLSYVARGLHFTGEVRSTNVWPYGVKFLGFSVYKMLKIGAFLISYSRGDKWRKYVHGVAKPRIRSRSTKKQNRTV